MPSLEIYNSTAVTYETFINNLSSFITSDNFMISVIGPSTLDNWNDINGDSLGFKTSSSSYVYLKFRNFCNNETDNDNFCILISASGSSENSILCIPMCNNSSYNAAFYNDADKTCTKANFTDSTVTVFSNFRAMKYMDSKTNFLSLGRPNESMTISTHIFTSIDDVTKTKTVFAVTDQDGYVSLYDAYNPYPWYVENTYHNGNNIGFTNSINAYRYTVKGYYCNNLYYFDGGSSMPGEGVSIIGGIKFLKLGDSNLFIKLD